MIKFLDLIKQDKNIHKSALKKLSKLFKKGDFVTFEPDTEHSSHTEKGCLILTFMRGENKRIKEK